MDSEKLMARLYEEVEMRYAQWKKLNRKWFDSECGKRSFFVLARELSHDQFEEQKNRF